MFSCSNFVINAVNVVSVVVSVVAPVVALYPPDETWVYVTEIGISPKALKALFVADCIADLNPIGLTPY
jgi:hypothetical protein